MPRRASPAARRAVPAETPSTTGTWPAIAPTTPVSDPAALSVGQRGELAGVDQRDDAVGTGLQAEGHASLEARKVQLAVLVERRHEDRKHAPHLGPGAGGDRVSHAAVRYGLRQLFVNIRDLTCSICK